MPCGRRSPEPGRAFEPRYFPGLNSLNVPLLSAGIRDRPDPDPPQPHDRVADRLAHLPHLVGAALVDGDRQHRLVAVPAAHGVDDAHIRRRGPAPVDDDAAREAGERTRVRRPRTRAWYSRSTSCRGCVRRAASSPSFVSISRPSVS